MIRRSVHVSTSGKQGESGVDATDVADLVRGDLDGAHARIVVVASVLSISQISEPGLYQPTVLSGRGSEV